MEKYRSALEKVLEAKFGEHNPHIDAVALVGKRPNTPSYNKQDDLVRSIDARMITYDTLMEEALDSYQDYLEADVRISRVNAILDRVGAAVEAEVAEGEHEADDARLVSANEAAPVATATGEASRRPSSQQL